MSSLRNEFAIRVHGETVVFATYAQMLEALDYYPPTAKCMRRQVSDWQWTS